MLTKRRVKTASANLRYYPRIFIFSMVYKLKLFIFFFLTFIGVCYGQSDNEDLIALMEEYGDNYGSPGYRHDFVDTQLNPALLQVESITCNSKDYAVFQAFLKMLTRTRGSANEAPADVLGGVFICKPEVVEKLLTQVYTHEFLIDLLEFGFDNRTYNRQGEIENYSRLRERLNGLRK